MSAKRNPTGDIDVVDAGLFLKAALKEGLLQEKPDVPDVVFINAALKRRGTEEGLLSPGNYRAAVYSMSMSERSVHEIPHRVAWASGGEEISHDGRVSPRRIKLS